VENNPFSVPVHFRNCSPEDALQVQKIVKQVRKLGILGFLVCLGFVIVFYHRWQARVPNWNFARGRRCLSSVPDSSGTKEKH